MAPGMLEVGRRSPRADRRKASEGAEGPDGNCPEDCACTESCGLEETGLRHPAFTGREPANWFSASSTADKKSYKEAETVGLGIQKSRNTLLLLFQACGMFVGADTCKQETKAWKAVVGSLTTFDLAHKPTPPLFLKILFF